MVTQKKLGDVTFERGSAFGPILTAWCPSMGLQVAEFGPPPLQTIVAGLQNERKKGLKLEVTLEGHCKADN